MNYILNLNQKQLLELQKHYIDRVVENKNQYVLFFAKDNAITVTAYKSGKVMFQGLTAKSEYEAWQDHFSMKHATIGSDEVGTGDYFGPMIVVSAYLPVHHIKACQDLGVGDSKTFTDEKIMRIANELRQFIIHKPVILNNHYYNKMYEHYGNMNKLKAILHNRALVEMDKMKKADQVIVDQFCPPNKYFEHINDQIDVFEDIHFETKAESKYMAVAVASILARYYFLQEWEKLEREHDLKLPKGASNEVDKVAKKIIDEKGLDFMRNIAKINFKNTTKAINLGK